MMNIRIFTILIVVACFKSKLAVSEAEVSYCYSNDRHPYVYANTKTPYYYNHSSIKDISVPNCKPVQIWMITRHGTRNPARDEINAMRKQLPELQRNIVKNHEKHGRGNLCDEDIRNLKKWAIDPSLTKDKHKYLTKQGIKDLTTLGERFKDYLPELFQADSDKYVFKSTDTQRTIASMKSFINGAFGKVSMNTEVIPDDEDTLLKVYLVCKDWLHKQNSSKYDESYAFLDSPVFHNVIRNVSRRLGFENDLSLDDVIIMYTTCVFERAWNLGKLSPWCAAFRENEMKAFDYHEDLYYYYHRSYGNKAIGKIGCTALQDMFSHFAKLESGDSDEEPKGVFYYTHSSMVQVHLRILGYAKDSTPITGSNYKSMRDTRKWRTSFLVPFGANFAAVFYKCDSSNKVRFYLNEKPLDYEGCDDGICDWEYLKEKLGSIAFNCNANFCAHSTAD